MNSNSSIGTLGTVTQSIMELKLEECVANFFWLRWGGACCVGAPTCVTCTQLYTQVLLDPWWAFSLPDTFYTTTHTHSLCSRVNSFFCCMRRGVIVVIVTAPCRCATKSRRTILCGALCSVLTCLQAKPQGACALGWHCGGTTPVHTLACYQPATHKGDH